MSEPSETLSDETYEIEEPDLSGDDSVVDNGEDPTPAEIRRRCAAIRRNWSRKERWRRAGWRPSIIGIRVVKHPKGTR